MKKLLASLLVLCFGASLFAKIRSDYDPLLVVVIMVKDEAEVIRPTLEMYCKADPTGKDIAYIVYDTGLDPNSPTMQNARKLFEDYNLTNFVIIQEPFVDFATSRNRGLDLVEKYFPNAAFMLMPDAEWYMHNVELLVAFCLQELQYPERHSYLVRIVSTDLDFGTQRLLRCGSGARFGGVVHETISIGTPFKTPNEVYFELRPARYGIEKTQRRWNRDRDLLLKAHLDNPQDSRTCFYLAQTYDCLGDLENAYKYYDARVKLIGWPEEDMIARYRLANVIERMSQEAKGDWALALDNYLKAFAMRPSRAEALIRIAVHYLSLGEHALAYLFARRACEIAYPENDTLFVEKEAYEYTRYDILGQCAWYESEFEAGEKAIQEALKVHDEYPHLHTNLEFYLNRKRALESRNAAAAG